MQATISRGSKARYASVETGVTAFELLLQFYLLEFYVRGCGLNPLLASACAAIAVCWDAISDPLMGHISDHTRSPRWGRRSGYILIGGFALALSGYAIFTPPDTSSQWTLSAWFLVSYLAVNTAMTMVTVPHIAVVGDLAQTSETRNSFFGWRLLFSNLGLLLGIMLPSLLVKSHGMEGRSLASLIAGGVLISTTALCVGVLRQHRGQNAHQQPVACKVSVLGSILGTFRNRFFRILLITFCLAAIARALNSGFALFYYKEVLLLDEATSVAAILLLFIVCIIAGIPLWLWLGKRYWKKKPAFWGIFSIGTLTCISYPLFPQGNTTGPFLMAIAGGIAVGAILLIESLVLDTVDLDPEAPGESRKDGSYFGCLKMTSKLARAAGILLTGPLLLWAGYDAELDFQSSFTQDRIRWVFGLGVGFFFLTSAFVFHRFPSDNHTLQNS